MSTVALPNGTIITRIPRADVLARIARIPLGVIPYSQARINQFTARRSDCSGAWSYANNTPTSGRGIYLEAYSTGTAATEQVIIPIDWADLLPGDAVGYMAPNSPGNGGHVALWMGGDRAPGGTFDIWDHGSGMGPKRRRVRWDGQSTGWMHPSKLRPWRYVGIVESDGTTYQPGGSLVDEEEWMSTQELQRALNDAGANPPLVVDGSYGTKTHTAFVTALKPNAGGGVSEARAREIADEQIDSAIDTPSEK